jgi:hypothetical protein
MPSTLSWLDHDPAERDRMHRLLAQYDEHETRDELGLGSLRDAIADMLFPGTSTIQTRLRYMLFVPWMYREFEQRGVPSRSIASEGRSVEVGLILALLADDPNAEGVIGRRSKAKLERLPSSVYWAGLGTWGIRRTPLHQDGYHRSLDFVYLRRKALRKLDDGESVGDPQSVTWHPKLPPAPKDFPKAASFLLTHDEAMFLRDVIVQQCRGSLLAWLALHGKPAEPAPVWLHPQLGSFEPAHRVLVDHGRVLSDLMYGAAVLYNVMLAEACNHKSSAGHQEAWSDWVGAPIDGLPDWRPDKLWDLLRDAGHVVPPSAMRFVEQWLALRRFGLDRADAAAEARQLIKARELRLKGGRARLHNQGLLDRWQGESGLLPLSYRWYTAHRFLADLHAALGTN